MPIRTCIHLEPLEAELASRGIVLADGMTSPYGEQSGIWYECRATFDGDAVLRRLGLADCVSFEEYDGRVAGSDATFYCSECKRAIMGLHPRYAPAGVPRVTG